MKYAYSLKVALDELPEWNACLELCKTELLFKSEADLLMFLLRYSWNDQ